MASQKELVKHKRGAKSIRRTKRAFIKLNAYGRPKGYPNVKSFIKPEPYIEGSVKAPRMIQARSDEFCADAGLAFMKVEERLWKYEENGIKVFAKGMSSFQVADCFYQAAGLFQDPVFILLDHSKFDSCILLRWIESKRRFNDKLGLSDITDEVASIQCHNRCYSKGGLQYNCEARLMSGDYDTSLTGNEINWAVVSDVFRDVAHHKILCGDDGVVILERRDAEAMDLGPETWAAYGFKTTIDVVDILEHVAFCQTRPVEIRPGVWRMVREPIRAMSRGCVTVKRFTGVAWRRLVKSKGQSEMAVSDGVPVLQAWAEHLVRAAESRGKVSILRGEISYKATLESGLTPRHKEVHPCARSSFERAFGIDVTTQYWMEAWLDAITNRILPEGI